MDYLFIDTGNFFAEKTTRNRIVLYCFEHGLKSRVDGTRFVRTGINGLYGVFEEFPFILRQYPALCKDTRVRTSAVSVAVVVSSMLRLSSFRFGPRFRHLTESPSTPLPSECMAKTTRFIVGSFFISVGGCGGRGLKKAQKVRSRSTQVPGEGEMTTCLAL